MNYNQYDCFVQNTYIINKNMQAKIYMESTSSKQAPPLYKCGCGEQFHNKSDFKGHSISLHNAQNIPHSTHFLTPFTLIVIPTNQEEKSRQEPLPQHPVFHFVKEKTPTKGIVTVMQSSQLENTHHPSSDRQKSPKDKYKMAKSEIIVQTSPEEDQEEEIEWNGFRLCRNTMVQSDHFYCGKCMLTFLHPEQFIVHCLQACQRLKYAKSSHFILCDIPQEKTQQMRYMIIQSSLEKKETKKQQTQREIYIHKTIKDIVGDDITKLFTRYSAKTEWSFFCGGCNKIFPKSLLYAVHIRQRHQEIVPTNSSHILLRCRRELNRLKLVVCYLPQTITEGNDEEKYYCCCKPDAKMTIKKIIKHIMEVHKGISPIYGKKITSFLQTQPLRPIRSTIHVQQAPREIVQIQDPIFSMHSRNIDLRKDHRKPPFTCHSCDMQFNTAIGYNNHFHKHISQGHHHLGSHVVLRIQNSPKLIQWPISCLYISSQEMWPIKEPIYYCPCRPERVTMQRLIEHVSMVHSCISPVYKNPLH